MANGKIIFMLVLLIVFSGLTACSSAEKSMNERQNYMMPKKSDLPKNSKYKEPKKKKTYKPKKCKKKKTKSLY